MRSNNLYSPIKVSLVSTVKNDGSLIQEFLESILGQSRLPNEIVIVDGGSTDNTVEILNLFAAKMSMMGIKYKVMVSQGANVAQGLNTAIDNSENDIIACAQTGCRLDPHWLENLIKPFEEKPETEVVAGWYEPDARSTFEKIVAEITFPKLDKVDPDRFLPSFRSLAFRKSAWKRVGKIPEWLTTADDTLFDLNLKKAGCNFAFAPDAVVYWRPRSTIRDLFYQYYRYAKGDGYARLFFKNYLLIYIPYVFGLFLLLNGFAYKFLWILLLISSLAYLLLVPRPVMPIYKKIKSIKVFVIIPIIKLVIDLGRMLGYLLGLIERVKRRLSHRFFFIAR